MAAVNRHPGCPKEQWMALARDSLTAVGLEDFEDTAAKHLNVVQKKRLEIARSLATEPTMLMLDEVLGGLNTQEIADERVIHAYLGD